MFSRWSFFTQQLPILLALTTGCGESQPVDTISDPTSGAQEPALDGDTESLEAAIAKVTSLRDAIRDGFSNDDPDAAHGPLHEVGDVLLLIPEIAKTQPVSAETQTAIEREVNLLMDAFGEVDKTLHGQEGSTYEEESATIDTALTALKQACELASDVPPSNQQ